MAIKVPDLRSVPTENLDDMILRHEKQGMTGAESYLAAVRERADRLSPNLNVDITISHLRDHAKRKIFTTYGAIAEANRADWSDVRRVMPKHLDLILQICHSRGWPLLTSICVKKNEVKTGALSGDSLKGFIAGARRLKYPITSDEAFLVESQTACFAWDGID